MPLSQAQTFNFPNQTRGIGDSEFVSILLYYSVQKLDTIISQIKSHDESERLSSITRQIINTVRNCIPNQGRKIWASSLLANVFRENENYKDFNQFVSLLSILNHKIENSKK
jgi:hypothetical protein